jgi:2-dehydro-3-deoxygalactonokinase
MNDSENGSEALCAIYVDVGTTNTRVWLLRGTDVLARASEQVGVRDCAREATANVLRKTLKELISRVQDQANHPVETCMPVCVVAAGMIGSPLGLAELAHIPAPAGLQELSATSTSFSFPEVTNLPFVIVPGVRSRSLAGDFASADQGDVMRGEETLCVGLHALGFVEPPAVVLTLGSHWKAIQLGADGRIHGSVTSLAGEMIHAVQTQTILASSVGNDWPVRMSAEWLEAGMTEQRRSGLPRALFCVRLLELENKGTPADRLAYLSGAFIASDLDALIDRGVLSRDAPVVISGHAAITEAWAFALTQKSVVAVVLKEADTEKAFLAGLNRIMIEGIAIRVSSTSGSTRSSAVDPELNWRIRHGRNAAS